MEMTLISLGAGAVGANVAAALLREFNLGLLTNTLLGMLFGALGGQGLAAIGVAGGQGALGQIAGGAVAGAIVISVIGVIKKSLAK